MPDTIFSLYQQGVLNAVSVGEMPIESRPANQIDTKKYGEGARTIVSKWKLFEISACTIPCNQEAVAIAVSKGFVKAETAEKLFGKAEPKVLPTASPPVKQVTKTVEFTQKILRVNHVLPVDDEPALAKAVKTVYATVGKRQGRLYPIE